MTNKSHNRLAMKALPLALAGASILGVIIDSSACTSMVVGSKASLSGRPMLWKNRDTGTEDNFVERVERDGCYTFVALFNGGDSLLRDAWMGMNERGFAIMNTASYNLAPDTAVIKDREGEVMRRALEVCQTVEDFKNLLDTLPRPMGIQANFGVIDANGGGAYFEANDVTYTPYYLSDTKNDILVRTNYSESGTVDGGYGYIRRQNAETLLAEDMATGALTPMSFTETCSRSFYHALIGRDMAADTTMRWVVDQDFIPRYSTSASIVIEGINDIADSDKMTMWSAVGYAPCARVQAVHVNSVPENLRPTEPGWLSPECNRVKALKHKAFPIDRGNGHHYIDMDFLRPQIEEAHSQSLETYRRENARLRGVNLGQDRRRRHKNSSN
jgi:hypothetical protein